MRYWTFGLLLLCVIVSVGCTSKSSPGTPTAGSAEAGSNGSGAATAPPRQPIAVPASATPDQVVTTFLNALRAGDSPTTESLLTSVARQELAKHSLSVDVQSAPNAVYQVHQAQAVPNDPSGAHVKSVWTEKFDDGDETYEIVWALRHQNEGWRLAGMAMELIPGQQMQFLNFENPEDMLKKKDEAMAVMAAMQAPAAETAQQPIQSQPGQRPSIER